MVVYVIGARDEGMERGGLTFRKSRGSVSRAGEQESESGGKEKAEVKPQTQEQSLPSTHAHVFLTHSHEWYNPCRGCFPYSLGGCCCGERRLFGATLTRTLTISWTGEGTWGQRGSVQSKDVNKSLGINRRTGGGTWTSAA